MEKSKFMNRDWIATARTLSEALPNMQRYDGATIVVKFGGHAMGKADYVNAFAADIALLDQVGARPVVVHGGVIGAALAVATGSPAFAFHGAENGSISRLVIQEDNMILRGFNGVSHLAD